MIKKAQTMIVSIISLVIIIIVVVFIAIPLIIPSVKDLSANEIMEVNSLENETYTLLQDNPLSGSLTITGLTLTNNYTINYSSKIVSFVNGTTLDNYTGNYDYRADSFINNTTNRTLLNTVIIALIIGLVVMSFSLVKT